MKVAQWTIVVNTVAKVVGDNDKEAQVSTPEVLVIDSDSEGGENDAASPIVLLPRQL